MAVTIIQHLEYGSNDFNGDQRTSRILAARTPNVLVWESDSEDVTKTEITVGYSSELVRFIVYPDSSGQFTYDFKEIFKAIINDGLIDELDYSGTVLNDTNLFKTVTINLYVEEDEQVVEDLGDFYLMNAALNLDRIERHANMWLYEAESQNEAPPLLPIPFPSPSEHKGTQGFSTDQSLKVWKGFPFDIPVISWFQTDTVLLTSNVSGTTTYLGVEEFPENRVYRLIISDGSTDKVTLAEGKEVWTVKPDFPTTNFNIDLDVEIIDSCGIYIKWLNELGTWSYWLFEYYNFNRKAKTTETVNTFEQTWHQAQGTENIFKSQSVDTLNLSSRGLNKTESEQMASIAHSPMVYLYKREKGEAASTSSSAWERLTGIEVDIDYSDLKKRKFKAVVKATIRKRY